jgi:hypothetical protein
MKRVAACLGALALILTLGSLAGCGADGDTASSQQASAAVLARANANCRELRREVVELGRGAFAGATNLAEATTKRIVKPSIPLIESFSLRQQRLAKHSGDPTFELYTRLYEPIIALAHERLRIGEESTAPVNPAARGIEILTATVAGEQRQLAKKAGVADCAIDFEKVLRSALSS